MINRDNALALMPDDVSTDILNGVRQSSTFMKLAKKLPNMSTGVRSQPVLSALPMADFVNGDSGLKSVSKAEWAKKNLVAGEIAVIIPVPDAIIDDSSYDIWEQIKPLAVESISRVLDNQVFNGGNPKAPSEWPEA
ncbi:MAG: phage major capsid protein, partial [Clostridia bacterium]